MSALGKSGHIRSLQKQLIFWKFKVVFKICNGLKIILVLKIFLLSLYVFAKFIILSAEATHGTKNEVFQWAFIQ